MRPSTDLLLSIRIPSHQTPAGGVTIFKVVMTTALRSWSTEHRYSDFAALHEALSHHFPRHPPPLPLPPKHYRIPFFSASALNPDTLETRRIGLQSYLRAIAEDEDPRWRDTEDWRGFLDIPIARSIHGAAEALSSEAWLESHRHIDEGLREVRATLHRRDAFSRRSEPADARREGRDARAKLAHIGGELQSLESSLKLAGTERTIAEGERRRRGDMLEALKGERRTLERLADVSPATHRLSTPPAGERAGLLEGAHAMNSALSGHEHTPSPINGSPAIITRAATSSRAFGRTTPARETEETRGVDNAGLIQLQREHMRQQDVAVHGLGNVVRKQLEIGRAIHGELEVQNDLLDEMTEDVDKLGAKVRGARRQLDKIH